MSSVLNSTLKFHVEDSLQSLKLNFNLIEENVVKVEVKTMITSQSYQNYTDFMSLEKLIFIRTNCHT